jgi:hypothetical protein
VSTIIDVGKSMDDVAVMLMLVLICSCRMDRGGMMTDETPSDRMPADRSEDISPAVSYLDEESGYGPAVYHCIWRFMITIDQSIDQSINQSIYLPILDASRLNDAGDIISPIASHGTLFESSDDPMNERMDERESL